VLERNLLGMFISVAFAVGCGFGSWNGPRETGPRIEIERDSLDMASP